MSGKKAHPELVWPELLGNARRAAKDRGSAWSAYIVAHYRATGSLAPGCDARDFFAAWDAGIDTDGESVIMRVAEG